MAHCESNGHVTDNVTWPQKIEIVTPKCLKLYTSLTVQDWHMAITDHLKETTFCMAVDVTWFHKLKVIVYKFLKYFYLYSLNAQSIRVCEVARLQQLKSQPEYL